MYQHLLFFFVVIWILGRLSYAFDYSTELGFSEYIKNFYFTVTFLIGVIIIISYII
jgi:hypothetical protein